MKRVLVIGDIHGAYKALLQVLERARVTPQDHLIFLGDYADGWSQTPEVLDLLISMEQTHCITVIKGNHDDLLKRHLQGREMLPSWYQNGGAMTEQVYKRKTESEREKHLNFILSMKNYHLDGANRLFVHGGFAHLKGVGSVYFPEEFFWDRTLWEVALSTDENMPTTHIYYPKRLLLYKEIYIGHTPTLRYGQDTPMRRHCVWNLDTGGGFNGRVTAMDIHSKEIFQSDPSTELYPNEAGRVLLL